MSESREVRDQLGNTGKVRVIDIDALSQAFGPLLVDAPRPARLQRDLPAASSRVSAARRRPSIWSSS
jgi:hypothetical protein